LGQSPYSFICAIQNLGSAIIVVAGEVGEPCEHVELGEGGGGLLDGGGMFERGFAQVEEQFVFERVGAFVGAEDFFLHRFEFGCDEAFAACDGLFACVIGGDFGEVGFGDFDVVAEDVVEADFERRDARAFDFARSILCLRGRRGAVRRVFR
jgi:hypothetical protein